MRISEGTLLLKDVFCQIFGSIWGSSQLCFIDLWAVLFHVDKIYVVLWLIYVAVLSWGQLNWFWGWFWLFNSVFLAFQRVEFDIGCDVFSLVNMY